MPFAENNTDGFVGEKVKETTREIEASKWAARAL
jgi:hypothetical protein